MSFAEKGDIVTVDYTLKYTNGTVYDSTSGKEPLCFPLGEALFLPGLESVLLTMQIGDIKTLTLSAKDAFGGRFDELILTLPLDQVPDHINIAVGQRISIEQTQLFPIIATITAVTDTSVTLDANFSQAGTNFLLTIKLLDIEST